MYVCKNCGQTYSEPVKFCGKCGTVVEQAVPVQPVMNNGMAVNPNDLPKDGMGIAGFVCGLLAVTACCGVTSIPGLICSISSMNKVKKGLVDPSTKWMGTVGLVLSIIGLVLLLLVVLCLLFLEYFL